MLPREREPEAAVPSIYKRDPHQVLEEIVERWIAADEATRREQGLSPRIHDEEAQQRRIDDLEAELVRLRGAQPHAAALPAPESEQHVITPKDGDIVAPFEQSDHPRTARAPHGPDNPKSPTVIDAKPEPYDPIVNGLRQPPDDESWRDYIRPDGSISSYPLSGTRRDWGPIGGRS